MGLAVELWPNESLRRFHSWPLIQGGGSPCIDVRRFAIYSLHTSPGQSPYGCHIGCGPEHEIRDDRRSLNNSPADRGSPRIAADLRRWRASTQINAALRR